MYVQQILLRGRPVDIKNILKIVALSDFTDSFNRLKNFFPLPFSSGIERAMTLIFSRILKNLFYHSRNEI